MQPIKTVDEYFANAPEAVQGKLEELRRIIRGLVPDAEEKISYSMPFYGYKGRLVYFAHAKNHIGFYIPPPIIENHKDELSGYATSKSAIQFPLDKALPAPLIRKLIKARMEWNDKHAKQK